MCSRAVTKRDDAAPQDAQYSVADTRVYLADTTFSELVQWSDIKHMYLKSLHKTTYVYQN